MSEHADQPRHGQMPPPPIEAIYSDDPDLWLVTADTHAWFEAHDRDCNCDGVCSCDEGDTA